MRFEMGKNDVSLYETLADIYQKISGGFTVVWGLLPGGRFQLDTINVRGYPVKIFKNLEPSLREFYNAQFTKWSDREWIIYEGERYTYGKCLEIANALGAELVTSLGMKKGDRVGIAMRNYPEFLLAFLGVTAAGGVAVPLNALWKSEELEYAIKDSGCSVLIADPQRLKHCQGFMDTLGITGVVVRPEGDNMGCRTWTDVVTAGAKKPAPVVAVEPEDEAMIMYTSGSTGFPKGVCHTQRGVGTAMKIGELIGAVIPDPDMKALLAVPLFHITALSPIALCSIPVGGAIIMMRKWDAGAALNIIAKEKVTRFTGVPTMMRDILEHPDFDQDKISTMKNMLSGGAPAPPSQVAKMRSKAKKISSGQGYGLTETMAFGTSITGPDYIKHPTSCGRPIPLLVEIKILDPATGKEVPEGERGEVCIRSAMVMKCYYNKPAETAKSIDKNGFFHSGDIGKMEGGLVYILDRMKDIIIRGGENIDCSEVEAAICTHPGVRECSVFGLPDERLGEVVGAAIWCEAGVTPTDLTKAAATHLAKFKVPLAENIFLHTEELPKGATGKLDKKGLRTKYSAIVEQRPGQIQAKL